MSLNGVQTIKLTKQELKQIYIALEHYIDVFDYSMFGPEDPHLIMRRCEEIRRKIRSVKRK